MGSLTSRPKTLPVQQPEIVEIDDTPATTVTDTSTDDTTSSGTTTTTPTTDAATEAAARSTDLLEQSRGILSTVLTGYNGVLAQTTTPQRKSLLGE